MGVDKIKKLLHREHNYLKTKQKNTQKVTYWMGGNIWTQHTWYSQYTKNSYNSSSKKKKIGRGCEYISFQNRHKSGQQTEKMLNITNHQGNQSEDILPHKC